MTKIRLSLWLLIFILALPACTATLTPLPPEAIPVATPTAAPTPSGEVAAATCADVDAYWGNDWPRLLAALDRLIQTDQTCGPEPLLSKKYAGHFIFGVGLEEQGQPAAAIEQYRAALTIDPQRREALNALFRLKALPRPTPPVCLATPTPPPQPLPTATPFAAESIVTVSGQQFSLAGRPFVIKGVNYYPRQTPWEQFLTAADPAQMAPELDVIQQAGFNTLRVFLWYQPLFTCQPEDAIPNPAAFERLDRLFDLAEARDLKLMVSLNDLADVTFRPLYTDWAHYDAQTRAIVRRYRHRPGLLAWDVRNDGNHDYGPDARFSQAEVTAWLKHITGLIRAEDPAHLLTAGWSDDAAMTAPLVDFLSIQAWGDEAGQLPARLAHLRQASPKPIVLLAAGSPSAGSDSDTESTQTQHLAGAITAAQRAGVAGWVIWTAFDFEPAPGQAPAAEHRFGLWRVDLSPKPALDSLPLP
jgi:hypothetical protein